MRPADESSLNKVFCIENVVSFYIRICPRGDAASDAEAIAIEKWMFNPGKM